MSDELLTKEQLQASNGHLPDAYVMAFGGRIRLRQWNARERDRFDLETDKLRSAGQDIETLWRARVVAHSMVGDDGKQLWAVTDDKGRTVIDPAGIELIAGKSHREVVRAFKTASTLQGMDDDEDAEGN